MPCTMTTFIRIMAGDSSSSDNREVLMARIPRPLLRVIAYVRQIFRIDDIIDQEAVVELVRKDIDFRGPKAWILVAAIAIASLGLNTNSTAVIIGAMLISPLMGPIIGAGVAIGIWDVMLLLRSGRNLAIAVVISLVTSALYFFLSPFGQAESELVARTTPTLLDALIAIFGGIAGAVAVVRQDRSNVVPGVAIATALMPPLCTAGYGIAHMDPVFFFGGFYLFFINAVCIGAATFVVLRILKFRHIAIIDSARARRVRNIVFAVVVVTLLPSVLIMVRLVQEGLFENRVRRFVADFRAKHPTASVLVTDKAFTPDSSRIELTVIGDQISSNELKELDGMRDGYGLAAARMVVRQPGDIGRFALERDAKRKDLEHVIMHTDDMIASRDRTIDSLKSELGEVKNMNDEVERIRDEMMVVFDDVVNVGYHHPASGPAIVYVHARRTIRPARQRTMERWLRLRMDDSTVVMNVVR